MFTQTNRDRRKEHRFLQDPRPWTRVTSRNHTQLPNSEDAIELVAARPLCSNINLTDRYHNMCIVTDSEKHTTFLLHMGHYRSRVMQQGDCNAPVSILRAMNEILRDMIYKDLIIYIDDIMISSRNYKQHLEALRNVLLHWQDQQFW